MPVEELFTSLYPARPGQGPFVPGFMVEGKRLYGPDRLLMEGADDLTEQMGWRQEGYTVEPFLSEDEFRKLRDGIKEIVIALLRIAGLPVGKDFVLEHYHRVPGLTQEIHLGISRTLGKGFPTQMLPIQLSRVLGRISEILHIPLTTKHPDHTTLEGLFDIFIFRMIRPLSSDHNPLHRDAWLPYLRDIVNVWIPIAACNERSSLPVVPGSQTWKESEIERTESGAIVHGLEYVVPAVTGAKRPLRLMRPNPKENEVLLFTPYLIHGGAANLNEDMTRVSLELRLWRQP